MRVVTRLLVAVSALGLGSSAYSFAPFFSNFQDHYEANGSDVSELSAEENCGVCHVRAGGGGRRNAYGQDFARITLGQGAGFNGIEFLDSDKDSFINLEEIFLQTAPGSQDMAPVSRLDLTIEDGLLQVTNLEDCSALELISFGLSFVGSDENEPETTAINIEPESFESAISIAGSEGVVLAKCAGEGYVGSLQIEADEDETTEE